MSQLNSTDETASPLSRWLPLLGFAAGLFLVHYFWSLGGLLTLVGLGSLIFFHELGHFVACRLTGTRVDAFSIGFGPMLFGWRRGHTLYKLSAIPLGGYVKMAAENPGDLGTGAPDEFPSKSYAQRMFIMSNGVIFNVILAFVFYVWAFRIGVPFPRAELGDVAHGGAGWHAGLETGDMVTHINGEKVVSFDDLKLQVAFSSADERLDLTIRRGKETLRRTVRPVYSDLAGMPVIGVEVTYDREARAIMDGSSIARAGGRKGDVVLAVDGRPVAGVLRLAGVLRRLAGEKGTRDLKEIPLTIRVRHSTGEEEDLEVIVSLGEQAQLGIIPYVGRSVDKVAQGGAAAHLIRKGDRIHAVNGRPVFDLGVFQDTVRGDERVARIELERDGGRETIEVREPLTVRELADSMAGAMNMESTRLAPRTNMPAERAGLKAGDRVIRIGGTDVKDWETIKAAILENGREPVSITVERDGAELTLMVEPAGQPDKSLGYAFRMGYLPHVEHSVWSAMAMGWRRTVVSMKSVVLTIRSLVTGRVSGRHIGGPIKLAQVTYQMVDLGWARYLYILALISINLAILNILPIPILDGGQIALLTVEKLRGKPTPERVVGWLQMAGLMLILMLFALALHNDISGLFDK